jgi:hypothetical protein
MKQVMPRFAILDHDYPVQHWDLLLEAGERLRAWRLPAAPQAGAFIAAEPLPDHRLIYLDYEGPVSGNRGRVVRWDAGTFEWRHDGDDEVRVSMMGKRINGDVTLRRMNDGNWEWSCSPPPSTGSGRGREAGKGGR